MRGEEKGRRGEKEGGGGREEEGEEGRGREEEEERKKGGKGHLPAGYRRKLGSAVNAFASILRA